MADNTTNNDPLAKVTPELIGMSKEDALKFLELPLDANDFAIDEGFWKLSKRTRSIKDEAEREQKMIDISYAYDVATGKEEKRIKALEQRAAEKKYFGKTKGEWGVYFGYTWYRYLIALVAIICIIAIVYRVVFTPDEDIAVLSVGHFEVNVDVMEDRLKNEGMKNPFVNNSNLVVPNDQGEMNGSYADMTSSVLFVAQPDIVVTDEMTVKYFFEQFQDLSIYYEGLEEQIGSEAFSKIEPIYCTEYEAGVLSMEYLESQAMDTDRNELLTMSHDRMLIGLMIKDETLIKKLGYFNLWPNSEATLVFGIGAGCDDRAQSERILTSIFSELD